MASRTRQSAALAAMILAGAARALHAAPQVAIVRVDVAKPIPGTTFNIVYRVTAGTVDDLQVRVLPDTADRGSVFTLAPGTSAVREAKVRALAAGTLVVKIGVGEAVGRILDCNSQGICHGFKTRYGNYAFDSITLTVLAPGSAELQGPRVTDISPDFPDGSATDDASPAGIAGQLIGSADRLIAVSRTSGLWIMTNGRWSPLADSPRGAHRIAVDPTDPSHLAVATYLEPERDGGLSDSGLWESWDAGKSWQKVYPKVGGERIHDVAFGPATGTLFAATTDHGALRREKVGSTAEARYQFQTASPTATDQPGRDIIALATGPTTVWAASATQLFRSPADGRFDAQALAPWTVHDLPDPARTLPLDVRAPARSLFPDMWPAEGARVTNVNLNAQPRNFAALDAFAFMPVKTSVPMPPPGACRADPRPFACADVRCDSDNEEFKPNATACDPTGNNSTILTFDLARNAWTIRTTGDGDGTGLGGGRFMKTYTTTCATAPAVVGGRWHVFHGSGQGVQQAMQISATGDVLWSDVAHAFRAPFHHDLWDVHIPNPYCPAPDAPAFVATDGGVFAAVTPSGGFGTRPNPEFNGNVGGMDWRSLNAGLHTHNVHDVAVVQGAGGHPALLAYIAYITTDNGGWYRGRDGLWRHDKSGDAGLVGADPLGRTPAFENVAPGFLLRGLHNTKAMLDWDGGTSGFDLSDDAGLFADHDSGFQVVFTQPGEAADGRLRVVTLARLPLVNDDGSRCCSDAATGLRVVFNRDFGGAPRMVDDHWAARGPALPDDGRRVWPVGSRDAPGLFVTAGTAGASAKLLHWNAGTDWSELANDVMPAEHVDPTAWTGAPGPAPNGPVFAKPYAPVEAFAIAGSPAGVVRFHGPAFDRCMLDALDALLSHSGRFAFDGRGNGATPPSRRAFFWNDELGAVGKTFQGGGYTLPSDMAFEAVEGPGWVAAVSPFGDVFVAQLGLKPERPLPANTCDPLWRDLTGTLPRPLAPVSSVAWDGQKLILGTEGRGLLQVSSVDRAPVATYFTLTTSTPKRLVLHRGDGRPVPYAPIHLVLRQPTDPSAATTTPALHLDLRGDADGAYDLPLATAPCTGVNCTGNPPPPPIAFATFAGDGLLAPTEFRWRH